MAELLRRSPLAQRERLADALADQCSGALPLTSRLAFGTLAVLLLVGAAVATSTIVAGPAPAPRTTAHVTALEGGLALRPDLVRDARWPFTAEVAPTDDATEDPAVEQPEEPQLMSANPAAGSVESARAVVDEFYRRLPHDVPAALDSVDPDLLTGQRTALVRAWRDAESVHPRTRVEPDGAVLAEVEVRYPAGDQVLLRQRLTVDPDSDPKITGAELLWARHTTSR
ncbi:hypothetical protein [Saccharopolyspora hordei]|uniref:Uncharacterized protein n=1 Tax=Saccharopolyspora hordei TaxID=1838 RepID=A0A853ADS1_9PSEU|nr:hypothetical protein [Saccharopolyspora hordei]NYI82642.1 hypothetical protein [Saccharopolyspora hordei]